MENIRTFFSNIDSKKALYVILGLLAGSVVLFMLLTAGNSGDIDTFPEEGSLQDFSKRARLIDGDQLVAQLGGVRQLNAVSEDLRYFAVNAYSTYKSESTPVVGFRVDRNSKKDGDKVSFSGSFGSSKNLVKIEVTILKNDRVKTTITDTKTKLNVDSKLPSNKKINAYIAELPKNGQTYTAEYVRSSDSISIFLIERNPDLLRGALSDLQTYMDDGSYDRERIEVLYPQEALGQ